MPERSLRAILSVAAVIALCWIGAAIFSRVHDTSFRWPFVAIWAIVVAAVVAYAVRHTLRAGDEVIDRGCKQAPQAKRNSQAPKADSNLR